MIKLVVFDWNGVLIADAEACKDAQNHILKRYGRKPITLARWREINVIPAKNFFLKMGFTDEEVEAGKHFGVITVAITGGYYSKRRLVQARPDYLIDSLRELPSIIKKV